jgi:hypothetical protein
VTAPEGFNHHHQKDSFKRRNTPCRAKSVSLSTSDDDDGARKRAPIQDDPEAEFCERLKERAWSAGPIADVHAIAQIVNEGLRYDRNLFRAFLEFELQLTAAEQIHNPAGHYTSLIRRFHVMRADRRRAEIAELARQLHEKPGPASPVCSLANSHCNGRGEIYHNGDLVGICECEAGRALPAAVRELFAKLNDRSVKLARGAA